MKTAGLIVLSALCAFQIHTVSAEMYRWTDDQGNVVYSQSPPPDDRAVTTVAPPPEPSQEEAAAARERLHRQIEQLNTENEKKLKARQEQSEAAEKAQANQKRCEQAKSNLEILTSRPPNTLYSVDGEEYKRFTAEEYDAKLKSYQDAIKKYCGK